MKLLLLFISAICLSTTGISQRAEAQNYPWCAYYGGFDDGGTNCGFTTSSAWKPREGSAAIVSRIRNISLQPGLIDRTKYKAAIHIEHQFRARRAAQPGDKKCLARQHLRFPLQSLSAPPSRHWPQPSTIIASPTLIRRFITWSPTLAVRRMAAHLAVTKVPHHQIAGDVLHSTPCLILREQLGR